MSQIVYVGGYTTPDRMGQADGINVYRIESPLGRWSHLQHVPAFDNPSFLRIGPDGRTLYAVHGGRSCVSGFAITPESGHLSPLNRQDSGGRNPVDLGFDPAGRHVVVAHYTSGSIGVLPVAGDGSLGVLAQSIALTDTRAIKTEDQPGPLPHGVTPDATGRFLLVPDKGLDRLFTFTFENDVLVPAAQPFAPTRPGSGPRHAAFHPALQVLYVVCELSNTVEVFGWDGATGGLKPLQSVSSLPSDTVTGFASEIAVSPSGNCVYSSNRGHDSIARFSVNPQSGLLRFEECTPTGGREPRAFAIDPSGKALHVANQATDEITTFAIDAADGSLSGRVVSLRTGTPTAICFGR
jgi:6-phosphogluconolactonase